MLAGPTQGVRKTTDYGLYHFIGKHGLLWGLMPVTELQGCWRLLLCLSNAKQEIMPRLAPQKMKQKGIPRGLYFSLESQGKSQMVKFLPKTDLEIRRNGKLGFSERADGYKVEEKES